MSPLNRVAALAATAVALAAPVAVTSPAYAGTARASVVTAGPICPDHPSVPRFGTFVSSEGNVDVYRVPDRYGFKYVRVNCG